MLSLEILKFKLHLPQGSKHPEKARDQAKLSPYFQETLLPSLPKSSSQTERV